MLVVLRGERPGTTPHPDREHLFEHCRHWRMQQDELWKAVRSATGATDTARKSRDTSINQLFADRRCSEAILQFLASTDIGRAARQPPRAEAADTDSNSEPESQPVWVGGESENETGTRAQAAGEGADEGDAAEARAQEVIGLVLGRGVHRLVV